MVPSQILAEWLSKLVRIPSVNPTQAGPKAGVPGEAALGQAVAGWFAAFGGQVQTHEIYPNRRNIYGIWPGQTSRWAALDVHLDTVGVEQMADDPFSGRVSAGRLYGRGAVDTKASLAVALALLQQMQRQGIAPQPNLLIAATVDEENAARAAPEFARWVQAQQIPLTELLVAEPTHCRPVYGHKGSVRLKFTVEGVASHASQPERGKNAISAAARLVTALDAEHERLQALDTPLGPPSLTVALISGGVGANVVPDLCEVTVGRRTVVGEDGDAVMAQLAALARRACPLPLSVEKLGGLDAFWQPPDTPWLQQLAGWCAAAPETAPYGTNAWAYSHLPGECVVLGPGSIDQAHGDVEWVELAELEKLARIYARWWGITS
jgi:succinyl-diaminopimelate desuccinylase